MSNETYDAIRVGDKIRATHKTHGDVVTGEVIRRLKFDTLELHSVFLNSRHWNFQILETAKPKLPTKPGLYVLANANGEIFRDQPAGNRIFKLMSYGTWCEMELSSGVDKTPELEDLFQRYNWGLRRITGFELEGDSNG